MAETDDAAADDPDRHCCGRDLGGDAVPQSIELAIGYQQKAEHHALLATGFMDKEHESLARARALQAEFDRLRQVTGSIDRLTESDFATRVNFESTDAEHAKSMSNYHAMLKSRYRRAMWMPWVSVPPDPSPPPDPLAHPRLDP